MSKMHDPPKKMYSLNFTNNFHFKNFNKEKPNFTTDEVLLLGFLFKANNKELKRKYLPNFDKKLTNDIFTLIHSLRCKNLIRYFYPNNSYKLTELGKILIEEYLTIENQKSME